MIAWSNKLFFNYYTMRAIKKDEKALIDGL